MPRLFIAILLPHAIQSELAMHGGGVGGARWIRPDQLHCTLHFLGDCTEEEYRDISELLREIDEPSFEILIHGSGHFPLRGSPKTLWYGIDPSEGLMDLQSALGEILQMSGYELEDRKYHPHITAARISQELSPESIIPWLQSTSLLKYGPIRIESFALMSSRLKPEGSEYTVEEIFELQS